jgi:small subunit ribosomal protein S10
MNTQRIRIRLKAYDHKLLDQSAREIVDTAKRTGATVAGPIPLPTKINKYTVNRGRRTSTRSRASSSRSAPTSACWTSLEPTPQTVDALMKLDLSAGVDVEIKI